MTYRSETAPLHGIKPPPNCEGLHAKAQKTLAGYIRDYPVRCTKVDDGTFSCVNWKTGADLSAAMIVRGYALPDDNAAYDALTDKPRINGWGLWNTSCAPRYE